MSVTFLSPSSVSAGSGGPTFTVAKPAGAGSGDLVVISAWTTEQNPSIGAYWKLAGFTDLITDGTTGFGSNKNLVIDPGSSFRDFWWWGYRILDGSEGASFSLNIETGNHSLDSLLPASILAIAYENPDATTPILASSYTNLATLEGGITIPSLTPSEGNVLIADFVVERGTASTSLYPATPAGSVDAINNAYTVTRLDILDVAAPGILANDVYTPPAEGETLRGSAAAGGFGALQAEGDLIWNTATPSPSRQWLTASSGYWVFGTLVLKGGGTYVPPTPPPLVATQLTAPTHGTVTLGSDGHFTYNPVDSYTGPDSFTYQADATGATSDVATVNIIVTGVFPIFAQVPSWKVE